MDKKNFFTSLTNMFFLIVGFAMGSLGSYVHKNLDKFFEIEQKSKPNVVVYPEDGKFEVISIPDVEDEDNFYNIPEKKDIDNETLKTRLKLIERTTSLLSKASLVDKFYKNRPKYEKEFRILNNEFYNLAKLNKRYFGKKSVMAYNDIVIQKDQAGRYWWQVDVKYHYNYIRALRNGLYE